MFIAKTPIFLQFLMPSFTWKVRTRHKKLFLTFDDGPIPEVTPWVLDTLAEYNAKATFFCVGDNVRKHPEVFNRILQEGHAVGNHTFNHLNGWKTTTREYLDNVALCDELMQTELFRPPYGKLTWSQSAAMKKTHRIVMWDVLSGDFSPKLTPEKCLQFVKNHAGPGSVVVMHDSLKAEQTLRQLLPQSLAFFAAQGYQFESL